MHQSIDSHLHISQQSLTAPWDRGRGTGARIRFRQYSQRAFVCRRAELSSRRFALSILFRTSASSRSSHRDPTQRLHRKNLQSVETARLSTHRAHRPRFGFDRRNTEHPGPTSFDRLSRRRQGLTRRSTSTAARVGRSHRWMERDNCCLPVPSAEACRYEGIRMPGWSTTTSLWVDGTASSSNSFTRAGQLAGSCPSTSQRDNPSAASAWHGWIRTRPRTTRTLASGWTKFPIPVSERSSWSSGFVHKDTVPRPLGSTSGWAPMTEARRHPGSLYDYWDQLGVCRRMLSPGQARPASARS